MTSRWCWPGCGEKLLASSCELSAFSSHLQAFAPISANLKAEGGVLLLEAAASQLGTEPPDGRHSARPQPVRLPRRPRAPASHKQARPARGKLQTITWKKGVRTRRKWLADQGAKQGETTRRGGRSGSTSEVEPWFKQIGRSGWSERHCARQSRRGRRGSKLDGDRGGATVEGEIRQIHLGQNQDDGKQRQLEN